jgi:hypothetical protein
LMRYPVLRPFTELRIKPAMTWFPSVIPHLMRYPVLRPFSGLRIKPAMTHFYLKSSYITVYAQHQCVSDQVTSSSG